MTTQMHKRDDETQEVRCKTSISLANLTMAELLFPMPTRELRVELENFRVAYEQQNGRTDLTRNYTSLWPKEKREWLFKNDPKSYFDGLPPFVKAYMVHKMKEAAGVGNLDDMPETYLMLYVTQQMNSDDRSL